MGRFLSTSSQETAHQNRRRGWWTTSVLGIEKYIENKSPGLQAADKVLGAWDPIKVPVIDPPWETVTPKEPDFYRRWLWSSKWNCKVYHTGCFFFTGSPPKFSTFSSTIKCLTMCVRNMPKTRLICDICQKNAWDLASQHPTILQARRTEWIASTVYI